jgi:hypothetical protein
VATSLHHIVLAIQEKPHAAATSFVALALLAALRLRRKPDPLAYVACGVAAGLAIGTLQNAGACLLAIGAAFCLRDRTRGGASAWWLAATVAILAGAVRLFYPFLFETSGAARTPGTLDLAHKIAEGFDGAPWPRILAAVWALDPVLVTCAAVGILLWLAAAVRDPARRRSALRGDLAVCFALVVPYALVLGLYRESLVRFCLPFVPLLACCAAFAFQRLRGAHAAVRASVAVALVAAALWPALHFARIRCVPGPMEEAARWIEANTDPGETIVVMPKYDLPILPTSAALEQNARPAYRTIWAEYLAHVPRGVSRVRVDRSSSSPGSSRNPGSISSRRPSSICGATTRGISCSTSPDSRTGSCSARRSSQSESRRRSTTTDASAESCCGGPATTRCVRAPFRSSVCVRSGPPSRSTASRADVGFGPDRERNSRSSAGAGRSGASRKRVQSCSQACSPPRSNMRSAPARLS